MKKLNIYIIAIIVAISSVSCKKMLEIEPEGATLEEDAINSPEDLVPVLNAIYDVAANTMGGRTQLFNDLLSDDQANPPSNNDYQEIYNRAVLFFNGTTKNVYTDLYRIVNRANVIAYQLDRFPNADAQLRQKLLAESRFLRALAHFETVKLWAQPYGYTSDNSHPGIVIRTTPTTEPKARASVKEVYDLIISDLEYAVNNLPTTNGNYADKQAAQAMLASVYFQMNRFADAAQLANDVINTGKYSFDTAQINRFVKPDSSTETIFKFVSTSNVDNRAKDFTGNYRTDNNPNPALRLSADLYFTIVGDTLDKRKSLVRIFNEGQGNNEYYGSAKFDFDWASVPYVHLTALKLLRAEALAESNQDLSTAIADVNEIRKRAYGAGHKQLALNALPQAIIDAARYERRIELMCEGNRVQDLKRRGANGEAITIRTANWNCNGMLIQFPIEEKTSLFSMNPTGGCN
jgi:starch-binding outer membrane protein, SusD/RagB family